MSRENSMLKTRWTEERLSPYARFNQNIKPQIQISLLELLYLRVEVSKHTRDPSPPLLSENLFVFGTGSSRRREKIHPELGTLESLLWNSIRGTKASALKRRNSNNFLPPAFLFDDLPRTSFLHATYVCIIRYGTFECGHMFISGTNIILILKSRERQKEFTDFQ